MFTEMVAALARGEEPDPVRLRQRFRIALTKKLAVVRLPPAFWVRDPKINPRADHLLWAALLLGDREGVALVSSVLALELTESRRQGPGAEEMTARLDELAVELLRLVPAECRGRLQRQVECLLASSAIGNSAQDR